MNLSSFKESLSANEPPQNISVYLKALWFDRKGDWNKAHILIQDVDDNNAAWIHAYLHRKEGDIGNADYWYRRAGKTKPAFSLDKEWEKVVTALILLEKQMPSWSEGIIIIITYLFIACALLPHWVK